MNRMLFACALLALETSLLVAEDDITLKTAPPFVVNTVPEAGTNVVDAATTMQTKVTFSKKRADGSRS